MTRLSVNINKIATLRNTRHLDVPSVSKFARIACDAGAQGITIHPRPDERHIRAKDVSEIAELLKAYPDVEFNIEGNPFHGLIEHVENTLPHQATFVPDAVDSFTSASGWRFPRDVERLKPVVAQIKARGVRVSLFVDPDPGDMIAAAETGADRVELYTEPFAVRFAAGRPEDAVRAYADTARAARAAGLGVNAGHDLSLENLAPFLQAVPGIDEVSIGHALVADALEFGLAETVRQYLKSCRLETPR